MVDEARAVSNRGRINRTALEAIIEKVVHLHSSTLRLGVVPEAARVPQADASIIMASEIIDALGNLKHALLLDSGAIDKKETE